MNHLLNTIKNSFQHYIKGVLMTFICCCGTLSTWAQSNNLDTNNVANAPRYEIGIITCGTGEDLYASFGHAAIRVLDKVTNAEEVYNYGMFNFHEPNFVGKFVKGSLMYYVAKEPFLSFLPNYKSENRSVVEQTLNLNDADAQKVVRFLEENLQPENKYYPYDFVKDNCATRIEDLFIKVFGDRLQFSPVVGNSGMTFRNAMDQQMLNKHWLRFGIDLALGSYVDQAMTEKESMFLPNLLMQGFSAATLDGKRLVSEQQVIYDAPAQNNAYVPNTPMWLTIAILVLTILVFSLAPFKPIRNAWAMSLLIITGLLGCFFLFMWLGTRHAATSFNFNFLWAMPLNLVVAFTIFKPRKWHRTYAMVSIGAILMSVILHLSQVQQLPIVELIGFLMTMTYVHLYILRRANTLLGK